MVVPTRARREFLRKCLESLLKQDYPTDRYEIIVVEDGTSDGEDAVRDLSLRSPVTIRYQRIPHSGAATARNVGLSLANNQIVAFIDDDGMASASWPTRLVAALAQSGVAGVGGRVVPDYPDTSLGAAMLSDGTLSFRGPMLKWKGSQTWTLFPVATWPSGGRRWWISRDSMQDFQGEARGGRTPMFV